MTTKENKIEKICSIYTSDYHLEMILLPYINKKIDEKVNINILSNKDLRTTIKEVIAKINLPTDRKQDILNIGWNKNNDYIKMEHNKENNYKSIKESYVQNGIKETVFFIIGDQEYIEDSNKKIIKNIQGLDNIKIIDCYELNELCNDVNIIKYKYEKMLNSAGVKKILE